MAVKKSKSTKSTPPPAPASADKSTPPPVPDTEDARESSGDTGPSQIAVDDPSLDEEVEIAGGVPLPTDGRGASRGPRSVYAKVAETMEIGDSVHFADKNHALRLQVQLRKLKRGTALRPDPVTGGEGIRVWYTGPMIPRQKRARRDTLPEDIGSDRDLVETIE